MVGARPPLAFSVYEKGIVIQTGPALADALTFNEIVTVIVHNAGTTSAWGRTDGSLAETAWPSREIPAGQSRVFMLTPENGDAILSLIAATSSVNATYQVFKFRSSLVAELVSAAALMALFLLESFFEQVSATTIRFRAGFNTIRAASGEDLNFENDQNNVGLSIGNGANGPVNIRGDGTGGIGVGISPTASTTTLGFVSAYRTQWHAGIIRVYANNVIVQQTQIGTWDWLNGVAVTYYAGNGSDERHSLTATDRTRHVVADGDANQAFDTDEWAIEDGETINAGDLVELSATSPRVRAAQLGSSGGVGVCLAGGSGDVGGTVHATVRYFGLLVGTILADAAGVTAGERALPGAVNANEIDSQVAIEGTFARVTETAASGVAADVFLNGTH